MDICVGLKLNPADTIIWCCEIARQKSPRGQISFLTSAVVNSCVPKDEIDWLNFTWLAWTDLICDRKTVMLKTCLVKFVYLKVMVWKGGT